MNFIWSPEGIKNIFYIFFQTVTKILSLHEYWFLDEYYIKYDLMFTCYQVDGDVLASWLG